MEQVFKWLFLVLAFIAFVLAIIFLLGSRFDDKSYIYGLPLAAIFFIAGYYSTCAAWELMQ